MGNWISYYTYYFLGFRSYHYKVIVNTGDRFGAGTDANVEVVLFDEDDNSSDPIVLDNWLRDDFERGKEDDFYVMSNQMGTLTRTSKIARIQLWRDGWGFGDSWFVDSIRVENLATHDTSVFPMFRWVKPNYHYQIKHLSTSLPQHDEFQDQRLMELSEKKENYEYRQTVKDGPVQVSGVDP